MSALRWPRYKRDVSSNLHQLSPSTTTTASSPPLLSPPRPLNRQSCGWPEQHPSVNLRAANRRGARPAPAIIWPSSDPTEKTLSFLTSFHFTDPGPVELTPLLVFCLGVKTQLSESEAQTHTAGRHSSRLTLGLLSPNTDSLGNKLGNSSAKTRETTAAGSCFQELNNMLRADSVMDI